MRKQYHSRRVGAGTWIWDVHRLVWLSKSLPVLSVPISEIAEADENWWFQDSDAPPTPRAIAAHMALVQQADLKYPIILCSDGRLMDGMHRVVKALAEDRIEIKAARFVTTPAPDFRNIPLAELPYPDEDV